MRVLNEVLFFQGKGAVAQLGERLNGIQEARGSTPLSSTMQITVLPDTLAASAAFFIATGLNGRYPPGLWLCGRRVHSYLNAEVYHEPGHEAEETRP